MRFHYHLTLLVSSASRWINDTDQLVVEQVFITSFSRHRFQFALQLLQVFQLFLGILLKHNNNVVIVVRHAQESYTRNSSKFLESSIWCKFVHVRVWYRWKHSQSIKLSIFGHMHQTFLHKTELHSIRCTKTVQEKNLQKSMTTVVQINSYKFLLQNLSVCATLIPVKKKNNVSTF